MEEELFSWQCLLYTIVVLLKEVIKIPLTLNNRMKEMSHGLIKSIRDSPLLSVVGQEEAAEINFLIPILLCSSSFH